MAVPSPQIQYPHILAFWILNGVGVRDGREVEGEEVGEDLFFGEGVGEPDCADVGGLEGVVKDFGGVGVVPAEEKGPVSGRISLERLYGERGCRRDYTWERDRELGESGKIGEKSTIVSCQGRWDLDVLVSQKTPCLRVRLCEQD